MNEPIWVLRAVVDAVHDAQLAEHGGAGGVRGAGLVESARMRPANLPAYSGADICALATAYAFGIARDHPLMDGNERTAFLVTTSSCA